MSCMTFCLEVQLGTFIMRLIGKFLFQAITTKNVVPKILSERKPDLSLALGYLLSMDPSTNSKIALKIMIATQVSSSFTVFLKQYNWISLYWPYYVCQTPKQSHGFLLPFQCQNNTKYSFKFGLIFISWTRLYGLEFCYQSTQRDRVYRT